MAHIVMGIFGRNLVLSFSAAALLAGCGSRASSGGTATQAPAAAVRKVNPADQLSPTMVGAVAATKPSALPLQVKFELRDRPEVGQPVSVDLAIVPMSASVDRVSGKVEVGEGIELADGEQIPATDRPAEGVPIRHSIKVLPRHDGIFTVNAVVTVDAAGQSTTETYSMPVIAGAGLADASSTIARGTPATSTSTSTAATAAAQ